jgi:hypothetical protein
MLDFADGRPYKRSMTTTTNTTLTIRLDGHLKAKTFTVVSGTLEKGVLSVRGPRGGERGLVRNVKSGAWFLCDSRRTFAVAELS